MKFNKIFRTLSLVIILALLVVAIPATPALAQVPTVSVYPSSGSVGTTLTVTGTGFGLLATLFVHIFFYYSWAQTAQVTAQGTFNVSFSVPSNVPTGAVSVTVHTTPVYNLANQIAITYFTVTQATIVISPSSAYVAETVTVSGTGFTAVTNVTISFDTFSVGTATTDANGSFTATFTVPESYRGNHVVKATDASNRLDSASFTTKQSITISQTSGAVGDTVTISGTGFRAINLVTITFDAKVVATSPASVTTDSNGSFSASFNVPIGTSGTHEVEASDGTYEGSTSFTTLASFSLSQTTGYVGTEVTVSGTGFKANQSITITFANVQVGTAVTDANGYLSGKFTVPSVVSGTYNVEVSDGVNMESADFTVSVSVSLSQTTGNVGTELTVSGVGFVGTVTIKYDGIQVATATADASGAFSATFAVPASTGGNHTVTASNNTNTIQTTFVMESEAPPTPVPLLPEAGSKAKTEAYFDWEDVTDPSGVTYTLQIASDADFNNIVLERAGLTDSEYTITLEEKLESVSKKNPYYWRVRAIDGASNESKWTTPGEFYVGFTFTMPQWAIYLLFGLGALLLACLSFWLGRRTGYD